LNALNAIPIVGWLVAAVLCFFVTIPVYLLWNWLAPIYFGFLPKLYLDLPFWHVFGLLWLLSSLRGVVMPSVSANAESKK
jgi:hypothetical protein